MDCHLGTCKYCGKTAPENVYSGVLTCLWTGNLLEYVLLHAIAQGSDTDGSLVVDNSFADKQ